MKFLLHVIIASIAFSTISLHAIFGSSKKPASQSTGSVKLYGSRKDFEESLKPKKPGYIQQAKQKVSSTYSSVKDKLLGPKKISKKEQEKWLSKNFS